MSLLGLFGYFRQLIPHMSDITKPLDDLRYSKDVVSQWGQKQEEAFRKLKHALLSAPFLSFPDMSKRFYVATDASNNVGISAVLYQNNGLYWSNMKQEAVVLVMSCKECQKFNIAKKGYHPSKSIKANFPGEHWSLDLATYDTSRNGNGYLLVMVDVCTCFCILRPLPDKKAETIVRTLIQIFCDFGLPKRIQSDNGTEFVNDLMKRFARHSGFEHRLVTPYFPAANGTAEKWVHKTTITIKEMIRGATLDWDTYVPAYKPGDYIMVRVPDPMEKMNPTYKGPYKVVIKSTGGSYSLEDYEGKLAGRNFVPSQMIFVRKVADVPVDEIYDVESIVDHKEHDGNFLIYRVRWAGYGEEDNTWELPENFGDPTFITKYWNEHKRYIA
ncbi:hypothetical protein INT45_013997 [Circinella minor]|uniref:Integrase catalytic domain-containing protein n=1 Tax=Circinella minor TaxID=1195481 RepID=A0A8H7S374_9FUNG|nr:hypothetical protein INT45_013997 [Circinella minor]